MKFNDFDKMMREFEEALDQYVPETSYMVARLDGRGFTKLTKDFEKPFSGQFHDMMVKTVHALMTCGFNVLYGYTQSDEISLLFDPNERAFNRKVRKYDSILGGTASDAFSLELGKIAVLDCRVIPLPTVDDVCDYFLWRQEDSVRNALNSYCYWKLRDSGKSARAAARLTDGKSVSEKHEMLQKMGVDFDTVTMWKKYGAGVAWENISRTGYNPKTGENIEAERRVLVTNEELPVGTTYAHYIQSLL